MQSSRLRFSILAAAIACCHSHHTKDSNILTRRSLLYSNTTASLNTTASSNTTWTSLECQVDDARDQKRAIIGEEGLEKGRVPLT